jgi:hypothetical protein
MTAFQAPGEAVWLSEGEAPQDEPNMGSRWRSPASSALVPPLVSRSDAEAAGRVRNSRLSDKDHVKNGF